MMNSPINPMQLIQMIKNGNPKQVIMDMMKKNNGNNPIWNNALNMAEKQDSKGLEQLAKNLCESNGINFEQMVKQVKNSIGMK